MVSRTNFRACWSQKAELKGNSTLTRVVSALWLFFLTKKKKNHEINPKTHASKYLLWKTTQTLCKNLKKHLATKHHVQWKATSKEVQPGESWFACLSGFVVFSVDRSRGTAARRIEKNRFYNLSRPIELRAPFAPKETKSSPVANVGERKISRGRGRERTKGKSLLSRVLEGNENSLQ